MKKSILILGAALLLAFNSKAQNYTQATGGTLVSTTSTTGIMAGKGVYFTFTPDTTGVVMITVTGIGKSAGSSGGYVNLRYGSGTAPANGSAPTGTEIGTPYTTQATTGVPFTINYIVSLLTPGTQYWFDVDFYSATSTSSWQINSLNFTAYELK